MTPSSKVGIANRADGTIIDRHIFTVNVITPPWWNNGYQNCTYNTEGYRNFHKMADE